MLPLFAFALTCVATGVLAWLLARRGPRSAMLVAALLLVSLCAKAVLANHPHWEWRLLPWTAYAWIQRLTLYPLAAAFFGVAVTRLEVRWNRWVVAATALGIITYGCRENAWLGLPAAHGSATAHADVDHHLQQTTHYTCGPAACVAAASHCGVRIDERTMAARCLTHAQGSRLFDLYRGLALTLDAQHFAISIRQLSPAELLRDGQVAVLSNRGGAHALCLVGRGDHVLVHDPLLPAPQIWDLAALRRGHAGPAVVVRPRHVTRSPAAPPR